MIIVMWIWQPDALNLEMRPLHCLIDAASNEVPLKKKRNQHLFDASRLAEQTSCVAAAYCQATRAASRPYLHGLLVGVRQDREFARLGGQLSSARNRQSDLNCKGRDGLLVGSSPSNFSDTQFTRFAG